MGDGPAREDPGVGAAHSMAPGGRRKVGRKLGENATTAGKPMIGDSPGRLIASAPMWPVIVDIPLPFPLFGNDHLPIRGFGLMLVAALLSGNWWSLRLARRARISDDAVNNLFLYLVLAIVIGARVMYVVVNWREYADDPLSILAVHKGGMVFYGSFLGVVSVLYFFSRRYRLPVLATFDLFAVASALGIFVGRIGCLLVGDDYGKKCSAEFPLAIKFPSAFEEGSLFGLTISRNNGNLAGPMQGEWVHPAQIYMSLNGLILFLILNALWKRKRFDGQVTAAFLLIYPIGRSIIEFFRGDEDRGFVGPMSTSQFISIFVFAAGVLLWFRASRNGAAVHHAADEAAVG